MRSFSTILGSSQERAFRWLPGCPAFVSDIDRTLTTTHNEKCELQDAEELAPLGARLSAYFASHMLVTIWQYRISIIMLILFLALPSMGNAMGIERTETVECELANGEQFVLLAKHRWLPTAVFLRHVNSRENQGPFKVYYRARGTQDLVFTGASLDHESLESSPTLERMCASLGVYAKQPGTGYSLRMPGEQKFWVAAHTREPSHIESELKRRGLRKPAHAGALAMREGRLVREVPLVANSETDCFSRNNAAHCVVKAVLRADSTDRGENWQRVSIETVSYFYKTGTPLAQQAGIARPSLRTLLNFRNRNDEGDESSHSPSCPKTCDQ